MTVDNLYLNKLNYHHKKEERSVNDRLLESLGEYYVYHDIRKRCGLTFLQFIDKWERGVWEGI